jgi:hypothetical protein
MANFRAFRTRAMDARRILALGAPGSTSRSPQGDNGPLTAAAAGIPDVLALSSRRGDRNSCLDIVVAVLCVALYKACKRTGFDSHRFSPQGAGGNAPRQTLCGFRPPRLAWGPLR